FDGRAVPGSEHQPDVDPGTGGALADALQVLIDECWRGRRWVVETDIASCFSAIPHEKLMQAVQERVCDQPVLKLLRAMLRAGVMEDGQVRRTVAGTPQGGVFTPPTQMAISAS